MRIEMGDDERFSVSGVGMVSFQREHGPPITLIDVKYVPRLKKNLVSVVMLEEKGYDVVFSKGKAFLRHITMRQVKHIGSRVQNLYALEVQDAYKALRRKENVRDLVVERESKLPLNMQPQKKSQIILEEPQLEKQRGDHEKRSTHVDTSIRGGISIQVGRGITCSHTSRCEVGRFEVIVRRGLKLGKVH